MRSIVEADLMPFLLQHVGGHPMAAPDRPVFAR
jgi:prephenate dehydrogenase